MLRNLIVKTPYIFLYIKSMPYQINLFGCEIDMYILFPGKGQKLTQTLFSANPRLFYTTKWSTKKMFSHIIYPHKPCLNILSQLIRVLQAVSPYRTS